MTRISVFISSAMDELEAEREIAFETIQGLGMSAIGFEYDAGIRDPATESSIMVGRSNIIVFIVWKQCSLPVRKEYEEAVSRDKPIVILEKNLKTGEKRDVVLEDFMKKISGIHTYKKFRKPSELRSSLKDSLQDLIYEVFVKTVCELPDEEMSARIQTAIRAAKDLHIFARTPNLLFGPRDYLTANKNPNEKIGYELTQSRAEEAMNNKMTFRLIISSCSVIEEINKSTSPKALAGIVLNKLQKYYEGQTEGFKIASTSPYTSAPSYLTYLVADNTVIVWMKTPQTQHSFVTENAKLAYAFKYLSNDYFVRDMIDNCTESLIEQLRAIAGKTL